MVINLLSQGNITIDALLPLRSPSWWSSVCVWACRLSVPRQGGLSLPVHCMSCVGEERGVESISLKSFQKWRISWARGAGCSCQSCLEEKLEWPSGKIITSKGLQSKVIACLTFLVFVYIITDLTRTRVSCFPPGVKSTISKKFQIRYNLSLNLS